MKKRGKALSLILATVLGLTTALSGCGQEFAEENTTTTTATETVSLNETDLTVKPDTDNYIELALNVYYNDGDSNYYANEAGPSIYITEEGTYTLSFDCATDLSSEAQNAGVKYLNNLTAIYLLDMGAGNGAQSPLTACNIMYDKVVVDDTELTVTLDAPKSAFKSSGLFDTNDPVNAWDGSYISEVSASSDHVANFTTVTNPTKISVTFTLSDMVWSGEEAATSDNSTAVVCTNTYKNTSVYSDLDFTDMDALTLSKYLGNGINLGNTMEAYGRATLGTDASVSTYETYWGQPVTTAEMIQGMKDCGFDTIRIPVAWTNMMDYESGDYTINEALLDRVEEIVNYALDAQMFVIINDHWDGGWWGMFGSKTMQTKGQAWKLYEEMWTQIAERFKDYSDMLIFESANEELGNSLNDNTLCADSGALTEDQKYSTTNQINQKFVDIVRSTGGNNENRFLLIAGYNTDIDKTVDDRFVMPTDTATNKLLVSVHYYNPWSYCGAEMDNEWGTVYEYEVMDEQFAKLTKFTDEGYGVIIGEYAALPIWDLATSTATLKSNTYEYTSYLLDNCDLYNFVPVLWSCNDFYNKTSFSMIDETINDLFTSRCYAEESALGEEDYNFKVRDEMQVLKANAPTTRGNAVEGYVAGQPVAWIMWNGGAGTYSVGDTYNPDDCTEGITATDVLVNGAGEYTVSLDFAGGNTGLTFAALAIADAEVTYPDALIEIKSITVDGKELELIAEPYTTSDDGLCTRVNLLNEWVSKLPEEARNASGDLSNCSPVIIDKTELVDIKNITITFEYVTK